MSTVKVHQGQFASSSSRLRHVCLSSSTHCQRRQCPRECLWPASQHSPSESTKAAQKMGQVTTHASESSGHSNATAEGAGGMTAALCNAISIAWIRS
jgi:hypothetical protein